MPETTFEKQKVTIVWFSRERRIGRKTLCDPLAGYQIVSRCSFLPCVKTLVLAVRIRDEGVKDVAACDYADKSVTIGDRYGSYSLLAHYSRSIDQCTVATQSNNGMSHYCFYCNVVQGLRVPFASEG